MLLASKLAISGKKKVFLSWTLFFRTVHHIRHHKSFWPCKAFRSSTINIHNYIWKCLFVWPDKVSLIHLWGKMSVVGCACNKCVQQVSLLELDTDHVTQGGRVCRRLSLTNKGRPCKVHVVTKTSIWPRQFYLVFWNDLLFFKSQGAARLCLKVQTAANLASIY